MRPDRGAALLAAMLTVTLVATLASAAAWQQWRAIEVERSERVRVQASWLLTGALDWSRLILREDGLNGGADFLSEPWAVPLQESKLSSFLAGNNANAADEGKDLENAFLSGGITDQQGLLNVTNLVLTSGGINPSAHNAFAKLFESLGLPAQELNSLEQNLLSLKTNGPKSDVPIAPQRWAELANVGLSPNTLNALLPYATILPMATSLNLNTAPALAIQASIPGLDSAGAQNLINHRTTRPFGNLADAQKWLGTLGTAVNSTDHGVSSQYFQVVGRLRWDNLVVQETSLVWRNGSQVNTLWRVRGPQGIPASLSTISP
jgi:general secretion pathway protein K